MSAFSSPAQSQQPRRILMASSVPLAAPWNGADKNMARLLVCNDPYNQFVLQTSAEEVWPTDRVIAVRAAHTGAVPTPTEKLRALSFMLRNTHACNLVHIVASLRHSTKWSGQVLDRWYKAQRRPVVHTIPSIGDLPARQHTFAGDVTVVVSEHTRRLLENHGISNVVRIVPPVDVSQLQPRVAPEALVRSLALGSRAVLYPAHYGPTSGIAEMIRAFAQLPVELNDAVLVLACRAHADQNPAEEAERVRRLAAQAGIADRVRLIERVEDMPALMLACAITALVPGQLASKMDLPLVFLEALALGRPVIMTDMAPMNEALFGGGIAVQYGDIAQLIAALTTLLTDTQIRYQFATFGQAAVLDQCQPQRVVQQYQEIYQQASEAYITGKSSLQMSTK